MCHIFLPVFNFTSDESYARQVKLSCQPYVYYICKQYAAARPCSARNFPTFLGRLWSSPEIFTIYTKKIGTHSVHVASQMCQNCKNVFVLQSICIQQLHFHTRKATCLISISGCLEHMLYFIHTK